MTTQTIDLNKLQLRGIYVYTDQEQMKYATVEGDVDYALRKTIRMGAGLKYNKVHNGDTFWGSRVFLSTEIERVGRLQFQYEKSYLPTVQKTLFPVEMGRITWFKNF